MQGKGERKHLCLLIGKVNEKINEIRIFFSSLFSVLLVFLKIISYVKLCSAHSIHYKVARDKCSKKSKGK